MSKSVLSTSSTAEYFAKNLQQVGFSSLTKAVLTTLKEAVDNSLDACEDHGILPEIRVEIEKKGEGSSKNADLIRIRVVDNGPGISQENVARVFGQYLASSKFGRGRCSRGQQGIGISAATTWAQLTSARGVFVMTKTASMRKAFSAWVEVDIQKNEGLLKEKQWVDWDRSHGTSVEFLMDGRIQLNGEAGLFNYLQGTALVNPHLTLSYQLLDQPLQTLERVTTGMPVIPEAIEPHPHTMKLGEWIAYARLFGQWTLAQWLRKAFSRVHEGVLTELIKQGVVPALLEKKAQQATEGELRTLFQKIQSLPLPAPSTKSVLAIGEEGFAQSMQRLGKLDFFAVVSRKPAICDFKPVQVEVAVARLQESPSGAEEETAQVLRFANRVPLQFDKASCAIVQAIASVNWKAYGLSQPKEALPLGPYVVAVSIVSPFIKFKNASKETIDASEELVEEIRRALIQAGQKLARYLRREEKANELEEKIRHIEQFGPILVQSLARVTGASSQQEKKAYAGLLRLLGREAEETEFQLQEAHEALDAQGGGALPKRSEGGSS